jgi:hypothetical protein
METVRSRNPSLEHLKAELFKSFQYEYKQSLAIPCGEYLNQKIILLFFYSNLMVLKGGGGETKLRSQRNPFHANNFLHTGVYIGEEFNTIPWGNSG